MKTTQPKDWQEFLGRFASASDEDMIRMIWGKCADMGSSNGALMSVKRVTMFTEGLLAWHNKKLDQATQDAVEAERAKLITNLCDKCKLKIVESAK